MKLLNSPLLLGLIMVLGLGSRLCLADVPKCLRDLGLDPNRNRIIDGDYNLQIDMTDYSKDELIRLIDTVTHYTNVYPRFFPRIYDGKMSIVLSPSGISSTETFDHIRTRVEGDIQKVQGLMGATVRCEFHARPHPSASGGT